MVCNGNNQIYLVLSSTKRMKYLAPEVDKIGVGPQISMWIRSKGDSEILLVETKGNHLCLVKWQTLQWKNLSFLALKLGDLSRH